MNLSPHLSRLGVTEHHINHCRLPYEEEACTLADAGVDVFDRPLQMCPDTLDAWTGLQNAAELDGITLQVVSAFRSVEYQCNLIQNKLDRGLKLDDILRVNAIPGYSEHHSGRALDLTTPDYPPLEIEFDTSPAFQWLLKNAESHSFYLSYPKGNAARIDYEPWHWAYKSS